MKKRVALLMVSNMIKSRILYISLIVAIGISCFTGCTIGHTSKSKNANERNELKEESAFQKRNNNTYISIVYGRDNKNNYTEREMVFYTYDIETKKIEKECVIPFDAQYACGVVSKKNNKIYYSGRTTPNDINSNDGIWEYDMRTGKSTLLESENWSYNSITMMGTDKLFVMAVTKEHPIIPAYFDLKTKTFTYMPEANGEDFELYNCGPCDAQYNPSIDEIVCAYQNDAESYSSAYMEEHVAINTYIAFLSSDMLKNDNRIYPMNLTADDQVMSVTQISKNECLVGVHHTDVNNGNIDIEERLFSVMIDADKSYIKRISFPFDNSSDWKTLDGGKSFYFKKGIDNKGLYYYDTATEELTTIIKENSNNNGHVVCYTIVD